MSWISNSWSIYFQMQACELPSNQAENSHYTCDDDGELKCLPGWTGDMCDVPICKKGCDPLQGYCKRPGECRCKLGKWLFTMWCDERWRRGKERFFCFPSNCLFSSFSYKMCVCVSLKQPGRKDIHLSHRGKFHAIHGKYSFLVFCYWHRWTFFE